MQRWYLFPQMQFDKVYCRLNDGVGNVRILSYVGGFLFYIVKISHVSCTNLRLKLRYVWKCEIYIQFFHLFQSNDIWKHASWNIKAWHFIFTSYISQHWKKNYATSPPHSSNTKIVKLTKRGWKMEKCAYWK